MNTSTTFEFFGKTRTLFRRSRGGVVSPAFYYRTRTAGRQVWHNVGPDLDAAKKAAQEIIKSDIAGQDKFAALRESTAIRQKPSVTIAKLLEHYQVGAREVTEQTRKQNVNCFKNVLRRVHGEECDVEKLPLTELNGDLVYKFKQIILEASTDEDETRAQQMQRTANSLIRQARSLFSAEMRTYYKRSAHLELPDGIRDFLDEPIFRGTGKLDYNKPADVVIAKTFKALETLAPAGAASDENLYLAIWLALGFGMRKSEIAVAQTSWLITRDAVGYARGNVLGKNGQTPDIRVQLGAWDKIQTIVKDREGFILKGSAHERTEEVFRRASAWMRAMGWETQKTIHEFRAYAGCKVAESEGLLAAQRWLRHASYATTERNYGRYINAAAGEVALVVPALQLKTV